MLTKQEVDRLVTFLWQHSDGSEANRVARKQATRKLRDHCKAIKQFAAKKPGQVADTCNSQAELILRMAETLNS